MTREQNFRTSFIPQFAAYSGWGNIPRDELKKLPLSSIPAFSLDPGKTKYTKFDLLGKAIQGEQDFSVTIYYALPLYNGESAYLDHSDMINIIEQFINDPVYAPPSVLPGDSCRIECSMLTGAGAPVITYGNTRNAAIVNGKYVFTIF